MKFCNMCGVTDALVIFPSSFGSGYGVWSMDIRRSGSGNG